MHHSGTPALCAPCSWRAWGAVHLSKYCSIKGQLHVLPLIHQDLVWGKVLLISQHLHQSTHHQHHSRSWRVAHSSDESKHSLPLTWQICFVAYLLCLLQFHSAWSLHIYGSIVPNVHTIHVRISIHNSHPHGHLPSLDEINAPGWQPIWEATSVSQRPWLTMHSIQMKR